MFLTSNRRPDASSARNSVCPVCKAVFAKYRKWHVFCRSKCRKSAWTAGHRVGTYTDIRIDIAAIKAAQIMIAMDMAAIKTHFGIKEVQSAQHEGRQTQGDALEGGQVGRPMAQKGEKK